MENRRQQKISNVLLQDLAQIFQRESNNLFNGAFITVTVVKVTADLSYAKVYLSIFGKEKDAIFQLVESNRNVIRKILAERVKNQLRKVPDLKFFIDDSLDYAEKVENLLKE